MQTISDPVITFETSIPEDVYSTLRIQGLFREKLAERTQHLLALRFYQEHLLSLGQAARLAGMDRWRFIEFLAENGIAVLDFNEEELADEFAAAEELGRQLYREQEP
jgi:predicted HTH domain antitoxin